MTDNESGMDLEEAHFYHTIKEFSALVEKYGWDYIEKKLVEIYNVKQGDSPCKEGS